MKEETQKKIVKITATVAVLASLAAGLIFGAADDITPELKQASINQPPVVMELDEFGNATVDDDDEDADEKKDGFVVRLRQAIVSLPLAVRLLIVTPLWAIGTAIMTIVSWLWASPIGAFVTTVLVGFAVLVGLYAVTAKMLFPNVPLKKILSKGHLTTLFVVSLGIAGADMIAPLFWAKYPIASAGIKLGAGVLVIAILCSRVKKRSQYV